MQTIMSGLFSTESDLVVARLALAGTIHMHHVFEADLFGSHSPCMRKYSIARDIVANKIIGQAELASVVTFQKAHSSD